MERVGGRQTGISPPQADALPIVPPEVERPGFELPAGWKKLAGLQVGLPSTRAAILAELPHLLGHESLDRQVAHRAVHAVVMGLAAGRWGKEGAPITSIASTVTADRVLGALDQIDRVLSDLERVDPKFADSYQRFRLFAKRALDHSGPTGLWGPLSSHGPLDNHPGSPSSLYPNFQAKNPGGAGRVTETSPDLLKRTGEHHFEMLPGNALPFVGPNSPLFWALSAAGNNGPLALQRSVEGGAWKDSFGKVVSKIGSEGKEQPLYEIYGEAYASAHTSKDAFFGVEGTAARGDRDAYRFESKREQWVTVGCSQVTPGRRFAITLYELGPGKKRTAIDRSEGIAGPAGISTKIPKGRYEVEVEQIESDPRQPELREHPVGKRLGPALIAQREAWGSVYPDRVDREAEQDPNRYRVFVSGSSSDAAAGLPDRGQIQQGLASSAVQEQILAQTVQLLETTVQMMWLNPMLRPADDRSDPQLSSDPMIERFMRATSRLDHLFYGGALAKWIAAWMPAVTQRFPTPQTVANHADR